METYDIPINIIILENSEQNREDLVFCYIDILKTCKNQIEFEALIRMVQDDTRIITLREILTKDIQSKAKVLEETKNNR